MQLFLQKDSTLERVLSNCDAIFLKYFYSLFVFFLNSV